MAQTNRGHEKIEGMKKLRAWKNWGH